MHFFRITNPTIAPAHIIASICVIFSLHADGNLSGQDASAKGIVFYTETPASPESTATSAIFTKIESTNRNCTIYFLDGSSKTMNTSRLRLAIDVPQLNQDFENERKFKSLEKVLSDLKSARDRFGKTHATVVSLIERIEPMLAEFRSGKFLVGGRWIIPGENDFIGKTVPVLVTISGKRLTNAEFLTDYGFESLQIAHSGGVDTVQISDLPMNVREGWQLPSNEEIAKRKSDYEAEKIAKVAYEKSQLEKGLVPFESRWVTRAEYESITLDRQVRSIMLSNSYNNISFRVFQSLPDSLLCHSESLPEGKEIFFVMDASGEMNAEGTYKDRLYWCGTKTYETKGGEEKTVNCFCVNAEIAFGVVKSMLTDSTDSPDVERTDTSLTSTGSGFFISKSGLIVTNSHVISNAKGITVTVRSVELTAELILIDETTDVAILKVNTNAKPLPILPSFTAPLGSDILVAGYPNPTVQGYDVKVTKGVISGLKGLHNDETRFQMDAAIQQGNSGGPVIDRNGNVIGVTVAKLDEIAILAAQGSLPQNVNLGIRCDALFEVLSKLPPEHLSALNDVKLSVANETNFEDSVVFIRATIK